jgi:hypothetical protein
MEDTMNLSDLLVQLKEEHDRAVIELKKIDQAISALTRAVIHASFNSHFPSHLGWSETDHRWIESALPKWRNHDS